MLGLLFIYIMCHLNGAQILDNFADVHVAYRHNSVALLLHDEYQSDARELYLLCSYYQNGNQIKTILESKKFSSHPVFLSKSQNTVCLVSLLYALEVEELTATQTYIRASKIGRGLKLDDSVHSVYDDILKLSGQHMAVDLDISLGLGVEGKGLRLGSSTHKGVLNDLTISSASLSIKSVRNEHLKKLTHRKLVNSGSLVHDSTSVAQILSKYNSRTSRALEQSCDFSSLQSHHLQSHLSIRLISSNYPSYESFADCLLQLVLLASLHVDVTFIAAHPAPVLLSSSTPVTPHQASSDFYFTGNPPTDQNAYVQTGTSFDVPFSAMGLTGLGYVLGMIDSGIDDLSCFLVNYDGTETSRTPHMNYKSPITEKFRRKVIQYIAWADGAPRAEKDHGTWCGGASVGKCINASSLASAYNGLASDAKIAVFDVDAGGNWLDVPSLYDISLPPAYSAGARVHTNSWGTPGMGSYTSKALDVDRFMVDNPDFLFVVAAGNDGRSGYTSVHSPGVSKNALTVGASAAAPHHDKVIYFSGIGYNYDQHMIKPNIIAPGTLLTSAGARVGNETTSCNTQSMSGTSMATPIVAAAAILIRQYFENTSYWASFCRSGYRSCPEVSSLYGGFISGALLKAAVIHSGEGMEGSLSTYTSVLPAVNLTTPPDIYQGWGQVKLANLLPIDNTSRFDLYVADNEELTSYSKREYKVSVSDSSVPLRVTICWSDPPNVVWAAKNLINDLDLRVTSPTGVVYYGNGRQGDEFNPVERVVIDTDHVMSGDYVVEVLAHYLVEDGLRRDMQTYGIVITCQGEVLESLTSTSPIVDLSDLPTGESSLTCIGTDEVLIRFQLEDYAAGLSWEGLELVVSEYIPDELHPSPVFNCTFAPNKLTQTSDSNRIFQCTACLRDNTSYVATLDTSLASNNGGSLVRVSNSQCNNVFLSAFQEMMDLTLSNGKCNACLESEATVQVIMRANVSDDDFSEYSWHGAAHYSIKTSYGSTKGAGTLLVSDEQADIYCMQEGHYYFVLEDNQLFSVYQKHAKVTFIVTNSDGSYATYTLQGTSEAEVYIGPDSQIKITDPTPRYRPALSTLAISLICILGVIVICVLLYYVYSKTAKFRGVATHREELGHMATLEDTDNAL